MRCRTRRAVSGFVSQIGDNALAECQECRPDRLCRVTKVREGVGPERAEPLRRVLIILPTRLVSSMNLLGRLSEGRHGNLRPPPLGKRITALTGLLAKGEGLLTSFCEGDKGHAAESDVASLALYHDAQEPALSARRIDNEMETIPVGIATGPA